LYKYFSSERKYPEEAVRDSLEGLVSVTFLTSKCQIEQVTLLNSLGLAIDAEGKEYARLETGNYRWQARSPQVLPSPDIPA